MSSIIGPSSGGVDNSFNPGWNGFMEMVPFVISDIISLTLLNPFPTGVPLSGSLLKSNIFNNPTGGTWSISPITFFSAPTISLNSSIQSDIYTKDLIISQTAFIGTNVPQPLSNLIFFQTNLKNEQKFAMRIPINLGVNNYNLLQISSLENSVNLGDTNGNVDVYDFGSGLFTGNYNLDLCFNESFGPFSIGIRLESTTNISSIFAIRGFLLPFCS